jgi:hypothetical protein
LWFQYLFKVFSSPSINNKTIISKQIRFQKKLVLVLITILEINGIKNMVTISVSIVVFSLVSIPKQIQKSNLVLV